MLVILPLATGKVRNVRTKGGRTERDHPGHKAQHHEKLMSLETYLNLLLCQIKVFTSPCKQTGTDIFNLVCETPFGWYFTSRKKNSLSMRSKLFRLFSFFRLTGNYVIAKELVDWVDADLSW